MSRVRHRSALLSGVALVLAAAFVAGPVGAQGATRGPYGDDLFRPYEPPRRGPAPPEIELRAVGRVALPAPVVGGRTGVDRQGRLILLLRDGWVAVHPGSDPRVRRIQGVPGEGVVPDPTTWVAGGKRDRLRFRIEPDGRLRAEKRCWLGGDDGYRPKWILRLPGRPAGPPRTDGRAVYVGSADDRVYAMRARNGHRLWARDLGARVTRPLALWSGVLPVRDERDRGGGGRREATFRLLLAVPDGGRTVHVLDPHDGETLGTYTAAGDDDRLVTGAAVLPDGRVAVVRQGYRAEDVEVVLLHLTAASGDHEPPGTEVQEPRTTTSTSPARTSRPSSARTSTTSPASGKPGPPNAI